MDDGGVEWLCHPHALLRNSPLPVASGTGCCSSNVQRINLTGYSMMLEVRHNLEPRVVTLGRRGGEGHPRDSVTALFPPGLSLMSRALHTQHWNHSSSYKRHTSSPSIYIYRKSLFLLPASRRARSTTFPVTELLAIGISLLSHPFIWHVLDYLGILSAL